ncbi:Transcriptional regulator, TetR family (plasmid) [Cupriavidus taiwanensis]|uniref:Transcriptional regulator, TetR family n=1 Tax=Cupriavidus taiwanensis TaxID=164546 RepID=A0A375IPE7_9BURK|nr:TetR/AcrR family transcriptional regulator [Cupriavidus taiwanensis]SPK75968.1 Transcriptional regulator, TetR family [Cupriavidus taiwanensis]
MSEVLKASPRERILETAARLFTRDGFRATGVDRIIAESGVAKMSLYRHFESKSALILAVLDERHDTWMRWFIEEVEVRLADGTGLSVFADVLRIWFDTDSYRGCTFINVVAESGPCDDARLVRKAMAHKEDLRDYVGKVALRLGYSEPGALAEEIMLCMEGMIVRFQMTGDHEVVAAGRRYLAQLSVR